MQETMTMELKRSYDTLAQPLPEEAIQKVSKEVSRKAYDTTGYSYQYCVDRFNEALGLNGWGFDWHELKVSEGTFQSGRPFFDVTVFLSIWVDDPGNKRSCVGGHISGTYADALKGAITNGFKKTAAFWGVGRHAYQGVLDDDALYPKEMASEGLPPEGDKKPDEAKKQPENTQTGKSTGSDSHPQKNPPETGKEGAKTGVPGGSQKQFTIKNPGAPASEAQVRLIFTLLGQLGYEDSLMQHDYVASILDLEELNSMNDLNKGQANNTINQLKSEIARLQGQPEDDLPY